MVTVNIGHVEYSKMEVSAWSKSVSTGRISDSQYRSCRVIEGVASVNKFSPCKKTTSVTVTDRSR